MSFDEANTMLPMCLKSCNGLLLLLFVYVDASAGMGKFLGADPFSFENAMNALTLTVTQQSLHSNNTQSTKRNCFKHQMTETHDFFQQGKLKLSWWGRNITTAGKVCVCVCVC